MSVLASGTSTKTDGSKGFGKSHEVSMARSRASRFFSELYGMRVRLEGLAGEQV